MLNKMIYVIIKYLILKNIYYIIVIFINEIAHFTK